MLRSHIVDQITRERTYTELESHTPQLRLSPVLLIVVIVLVGFAVVMLGVRSVAQYTPAPLNPFPVYADVFPGQPMSAVDTTVFSCDKDYDYYQSAAIKCNFSPVEGMFSSIELIVHQDSIHQITFILRDNTLQVGDLMRFLQVPIIHRLYHTAYFFLPTSFVRAETLAFGEPFSLFLPVWNVSFTKLT
jgi:hypothetical protein